MNPLSARKNGTCALDLDTSVSISRGVWGKEKVLKVMLNDGRWCCRRLEHQCTYQPTYVSSGTEYLSLGTGVGVGWSNDACANFLILFFVGELLAAVYFPFPIILIIIIIIIIIIIMIIIN